MNNVMIYIIYYICLMNVKNVLDITNSIPLQPFPQGKNYLLFFRITHLFCDFSQTIVSINCIFICNLLL